MKPKPRSTVTLEARNPHSTPEFRLSIHALGCERDYRMLFEQLSFEIRNQDLIRVAGSNGAGKSTLLRALVGLNTDIDGHIYWNQVPIQQAEDYRAKLLYIGHQPGIKEELTALENLNWLLQCACPDALAPNRTALCIALDRLDLLPFADTLAAQLSAGQKRRIALARLWLDTSPLWVLDEPFTALDTKGISLVATKITEHAQTGGAVVLTTHQMLDVHYPLTTLDLDSDVVVGSTAMVKPTATLTPSTDASVLRGKSR